MEASSSSSSLFLPKISMEIFGKQPIKQPAPPTYKIFQNEFMSPPLPSKVPGHEIIMEVRNY
jgi:hypothetical protein